MIYLGMEEWELIPDMFGGVLVKQDNKSRKYRIYEGIALWGSLTGYMSVICYIVWGHKLFPVLLVSLFMSIVFLIIAIRLPNRIVKKD
jgi:hypothetical protein